MKKILGKKAVSLAFSVLFTATSFCGLAVNSFAATQIPGDVSGDGLVDSADAIMVARCDAGLINFSSDQIAIGDVTKDNKIDSSDAIKILRFDANIIKDVITGELTNPEVPMTAEKVATLINTATANAANKKAGYTWSRDRVIKEAIDVGSMTSVINTLVKSFDKSPDAGLDKTVGWFLETSATAGGGKPLTANAVKGQDLKDRKAFENIKASCLTAADITNFAVDGNNYKFSIANVTNPKRDNKSAFSRLTNDFLTEADVGAALSAETGGAISVANSSIKYKNINVTAVIKDGKLTEYKISYYFNAAPINIKAAGMSIKGTGGGQTDIVYTNFSY